MTTTAALMAWLLDEGYDPVTCDPATGCGWWTADGRPPVELHASAVTVADIIVCHPDHPAATDLLDQALNRHPDEWGDE